MESRGKINCYKCENCHEMHFTINLVEGVTPFMIECRLCAEIAQSCCYHLPILDGMPLTIKYAWYRPSQKAWPKMKKEEWKQHLLGGGLAMAPLEEALEKNADINFKGLDNKGITKLLEAFYK